MTSATAEAVAHIADYRARHLELLLISNGRSEAGFLAHALLAIDTLLADRRDAVFIPFASVTRSWKNYEDQVAEAVRPLDIQVQALLDPQTAHQRLEGAGSIIVGGGNTFELLRTLREWDLLELIRDRVRDGVPYVGWSAGSNLACPTIRTTNDMPIVDPDGCDALGLVNFQINPHFAAVRAGFGESREQRIAEFTRVNPDIGVIGLPDNTWLLFNAGGIHLGGGSVGATWFAEGAAPLHVPPGKLELVCPDGQPVGVAAS